jgi:arylsulfatase
VGGGDDYFRPRRLVDGDARVLTESLPADFYATDAFTTKAMEFIAEEDAGKPFFLYLAYNAPHARLMAPEQEIARQRGRYDAGFEAVAERRLARQKELGLVPADMRLPPRDPGSEPWSGTPAQLTEMRNMEVYAAMVARLDANIGRLVAFLEERGELDDTLILFLSDNGAWASGATYEQEWAETCDTPLRLFKLFTHEGGIRTPLIAHWPGRIRQGTVQSRHYAHVKDILPTLLEAAGAAPRDAAEPGPPSLPVTGRSFLPALLDPTHAAPETLCWERLGNEAVRDGRWKLVRAYSAVRNYNPVTKRGPGDGPRTGRWELYDLEADPGESCDLAAAEPVTADDVAALDGAWSADEA